MADPVDASLTIEPLSRHRELLPVFRDWFESEWPAYYHVGGPGEAARDLATFADDAELPIGLVALRAHRPCGIAVLKQESIATHKHLSPWAAAGLVPPSKRRRGIGSRLLAALED